MHPADASRLGVAGGSRVKVASRTGAIEVTLETTDAMRPGVVSLPHGWGHDREGMRLQTATAHAGASVNDVHDELRVDALAGTAAFSGLPVDVTPAAPSRIICGRREQEP
jgi:anaerobic selenocysteine-containing dehydrogenase